MIVIMKAGATRAQMVNVTARIEQMGCAGAHLGGRGAHHHRHHRQWAPAGPASRSSGWTGSSERCRCCDLSSWPAATFTRRTPSCPSTAYRSAAKNWSSWPARVPSRAVSSCWRRRTPSRKPGPRCCAAAPSSRAPRPTAFRGWAKRGCAFWPRRARRPGCRSSPR